MSSAWNELYVLGLPLVFNPSTLIMLLLGSVAGVIFGLLPGLTATMGVAITIPLTFGMTPQHAFALLLGVYCGGMYGGSISAILVKIPGTPASLMTVLDGHPMAQRGEAGKAIGIATVSSFIGGLISVVVLSLCAPLIANFALTFSAPEYCAVALFGLSVIVYISPESMIKGLLSACIGLLLATVGLDPITAYPRFTFGDVNLLGGLELLPVLLGVFGLGQVLSIAEAGKPAPSPAKGIYKIGRTVPTIREIRSMLPTIMRGSMIGTFIGAIPAAGGSIASIIAYGTEKRLSRHPEKFGSGIPEGIAASESANNATTGGAMIPMLTLGIPGDAVTAILVGALMIHGLQPGPLLFRDSPEVVSSIFLLMAMTNVAFLVIGLLGAMPLTRVMRVPMGILLPTILALCSVGAFAIRNSVFDLGVLIVFGVVGYVFGKAKIPSAPLVLGFILGPLVERNLRRALALSGGDVSTLWTRSISAFFLILTIVTIAGPWVIGLIRSRKAASS